MTTFYTSDLHINHKNINNIRPFVKDAEDNKRLIKESWNELISKDDKVFILGDASFNSAGYNWIKENLQGHLYLIRGNHDNSSIHKLLGVFHNVYGLLEKKDYYLSHAPIHPQELRGKVNLHGHSHDRLVRGECGIDMRYFNCCVENIYRITNGKQILIGEQQIEYYLEDPLDFMNLFR